MNKAYVNLTDLERAQELREACNRLFRVSRIGSHATRLAALNVLASAHDRVDRDWGSLLVWMNAGSRIDAELVIAAIHGGERKLIDQRRYEAVLKAFELLDREVTLPKLIDKGIATPFTYVPREEDEWDDADQMSEYNELTVAPCQAWEDEI